MYEFNFAVILLEKSIKVMLFFYYGRSNLLRQLVYKMINSKVKLLVPRFKNELVGHSVHYSIAKS